MSTVSKSRPRLIFPPSALVAFVVTLWIYLSHNILHSSDTSAWLWLLGTFIFTAIIVFAIFRLLPQYHFLIPLTSPLFQDKNLEDHIQQLVVEHLDATIGVFNQNFELLYISPSIERIAGYTIEEFFKLGVEDQVYPEDMVKVQQLIQRLLTTPGEKIRTTYRVFHKNGSVRWLEAYTESICKQNTNQVEYVIIIAFDITERKQYEDQLKASEERLRLITENASDILTIQNSEGKTTYVSHACKEILGYTPDEVLAMEPQMLIHPDDCTKLANAQASIMNKQTNDSMIEYRLLHKEKHPIWVEATAQTIQDPETHTIQSIIGITRDITKRKQVEADLYQQQAMFNLISENTTDIISILNIDGKMQFVTPSIGDILGYTQEEIVDISLCKLVHPDDKDMLLKDNYKERLQRGETLKHRYRARHKDGYYVHLEGIISAILTKDTNELHSVISVTRDITEQIRKEADLRREQLHLNLLAEQATDLLATYKPDGSFLFVSPSVKQLLGYNPQDLKGMPFFELLHDNDKEDWKNEYLKNLSEPKQLIRFEHRIRNRNGDYIWFETYTHSLMDEDNGVIEGLATISRDITERKKVERQLEESETRLRSIIDSPTDFIFLLDKQGHFLELNDTTAESFGGKREELIGKNIFDVFSPPAQPQTVTWFRQIQETDEIIPLEIERNGIWYNVIANLVFDEDDEINSIAIIGRDITDRKKMEDQIQKQEALYRMLAEHVTDVITRNKPDGILSYVSPSAKTVWGYQPHEVLHKSVASLIHPDDLRAVQAFFDSLLAADKTSNRVNRIKYRANHKQGHIIWVESSGQVVRDPETNEVEYIIGVHRDITEQVFAEEEVHLQLEQRLIAIGEHSDYLKKIARQIKRVLESVTPTGESLRQYAERIARNDQSHHINEMVRTADQLTDLITQLTGK